MLRNVAEEQRSHTEVCFENFKVRENLKERDADGSSILMVLTIKK
jgi:hypothetical protein